MGNRRPDTAGPLRSLYPPNVAARLLDSHPGELPGGLHGPFGRGMRGDPEQVDEPGAHVDDEEHVHPREVDQVHMKEVTGHERHSVGAQERTPRVDWASVGTAMSAGLRSADCGGYGPYLPFHPAQYRDLVPEHEYVKHYRHQHALDRNAVNQILSGNPTDRR